MTVDKIQLLRAIYIGFYHLQAFEYMRRFSSPINEENWLADNMPRVMARSHCLRGHLIFQYQSHLFLEKGVDKTNIPELIEAFNIQLMEDQRRHYEVIYDRAMGVCDNLRRGDWIGELGQSAFNELLEKIEETNLSKNVLIGENELRQIVLALTGWSR